MKKGKRSKEDEKWLQALGDHLQKMIKERGYKSHYDFWVQVAGDDISRAALNYILNGRVDVKATTLRKFANLLEIDTKELFNFKVK